MRFLFLLLALLPLHAFAQITPSDKPVSIEASQQLEWIRNENMYRATGDVVITQGTTVIKGNMAEAHYDAAVGSSALTTISVTGNVIITSEGRTIIADTATYDVKNEILNLRGSNVVITAQEMKVTAQNGIDYFAREHKATATGKAEVQQGTQNIKADTLTAWFSESDNKLERAAASGHVVISRQGNKGLEIAQADKADYNALKNTATLTGNVKITQGENHMQGAQAVVDMATGTASLRNDGQNKGRVRAIFTPGGGSPMPSVTSSVPMINAKKELAPLPAPDQTKAQ